MATTKNNSESKTPVLKKRTAPEEVENTNTTPTSEEPTKMPMKKRTLPTTTPSTEENPVVEKKTPLKKRTLPTTEGTTVPKPKKKNPLDIPTSKKTPGEETKPAEEMSSLERMRERIAAQKLLEQEMMTQQALRTQETDTLRGKLRELSKSLEEENEEVEDTPRREKPVIDFDLKSEALETQNKKLKKDLEKAKHDLQALLAIEFHNMKVLDANNLTLSNEFIEAVNAIKEQADLQNGNEEQSLKDELSLLQKELTSVRAQNEANQKASEEAQKLAAEASKAINKAKKAIKEQEDDQTRDFKKEISDLEKKVAEKTKELEKLTKDNETQKLEFEEKINTIKTDLESKAKELTKTIKENEKLIEKLNKEIEKVKAEKDALKEELSKANKENKKLTTDLSKITDKANLANGLEKENKELKTKVEELNNKATTLETSLTEKDAELKAKIDEILADQVKQVNELEKKIAELKANGIENEQLKKERVELENKLNEQANKIDELLIKYQEQLDDKSKEIDELRKELVEKDEKIQTLPTDEVVNTKDAEIVVLQQEIENIKATKDEKIKTLEEELNTAVNESIRKVEESKVTELQTKINDLTLSENKLQNENELLKEKIRLQEEYSEKTPKVDEELVQKCNQYQTLLLSERNSHLQVEQKLCKDLDEYKNEIEKLQKEITEMSSNYGLARLNQQVDAIEKYINDMKQTNVNIDNNDLYSEYYEKLIHNYEEERQMFIAEIEKRNKMLLLLRNEKAEIVKILKAKGKNTTNLENQVYNIDLLINQEVETNEIVKTEKIEEEILNNIKDDLIKYCDDVKARALKDIEDINNKYENIDNVTGLIKEYNEDCDKLTHQYGNEIARLNLERELVKDNDKKSAIEEKILMVKEQSKLLAEERDHKFNEAMEKIRTQSFKVTTESLETNNFAFVGEEYIKSLNQYAEMKQDIQDKIEAQNKKYEESIKGLKEQEEYLIAEGKDIKERIALINQQEEITDQDNLLKQELLASLKNNEIKIQNIMDNGYATIEKDHNFIINELEEDYKKIVDEEKKSKELYEQRENEAKNRLEIEKKIDEEIETAKANKMISDYVYIEGEAERIIYSVDEQREKLLEAQRAIDALKEESNNEEESTENIKEVLEEAPLEDTKVDQETKEEVVEEVPLEETKEIQEEATDIKTETTTDEKETLSRIRIEDNLDQKDLQAIKDLQEKIDDLKKQLKDNQEIVDELEGKYLMYTESEKDLEENSKDVLKYSECLNEEALVHEEVNRLTKELALIDIKVNKKAYKVKAAELKSMQHKQEYLENKVKSLKKNKNVDTYIKLINKIKEFEESFNNYKERNDGLKELISLKENELKVLKG